MIQIGDSLISRHVVEKKFVCNLKECKGACCVEGDSGAPFTDDELDIIEEIYEKVKPFMRKEGIETIEKQGKFVVDTDNERVTPLVNNRECAYVYFDGDIAKCAFEKAYLNGKTPFKKPISCHLYPIRVQNLSLYEAVNYDYWHICNPARSFGEKNNTPVYQFLKEPIERKYGKDWFLELDTIANEIEKRK
jgi:hypothetical protein